MITPFSIRPKPANKLAKYSAAACLGSAIIFVAVYMMIEKYRGIVGIGALVFITAAVYIYNRYVCARYSYDVAIDTNGDPIFVIRQTVGKRETTLCRVDISAIRAVKKLTCKEKKAYKSDSGTSVYCYYPTMRPEILYLVEVRCPYENADLFLELTDEHASLLMSYAVEARAFGSDIPTEDTDSME